MGTNIEVSQIPEERRLSYHLKPEDLKQYGNKICIVAGMGSGKNHWVENELSKLGSVLLITSRKAKEDETVEATEEMFINYVDSVPTLKKYVVMNHSRLANFIRKSEKSKDIFLEKHHFEYIVVDEAHSLICDSTFTDSSFHLWCFIEDCLKVSTVILMTATIEPIEYKMTHSNWSIKDFTSICENIKPNNLKVVTYKQALKLLKKTNHDNKAVYMSTGALKMVETIQPDLVEKLNMSSDKIAMIMSDQSTRDNIKDEIEREKSNICYESIIKEHKLPDEVEILLTTSRLKEGVNIIDSSIKSIFIESHYSVDIIQFMGRVRTPVDTLYIIDNALQNSKDINEEEIEYIIKSEKDNVNRYLFEEKIKSCSDILGDYSDRNVYKYEEVKKFVDFIEKKFEFIMFNHFTNKFEYYEQRYWGIKQHQEDIRRYRENKKIYLHKTTGINPENIVLDVNEQVVDNYVIENKLIGKILSKEDKAKILLDLTELGILMTNDKPYTKLGSLLKQFDYKLKPHGKKSKGYSEFLAM